MTLKQLIEALLLAKAMNDGEAALEILNNIQELGYGVHLLRKALS